MGQIIVEQPNGLLALFDTVSQGIVAWDMDEDEVVKHFVKRAKKDAKHETRLRIVRTRQAGTSGMGYSAVSWEDAVRRNHDNGYADVEIEGKA